MVAPVSLEDWQALGIVCGALLALFGLIGLLWRKVVRPVWRAAWRTIRRLNQVADDLLGDEVKGIPSMTQRMAAHERMLAEHLAWHGDPRGAPARPAPGAPNSTSRRRS